MKPLKTVSNGLIISKTKKTYQEKLAEICETLHTIANTTLDNECTAALTAFKKSQLEGSPITRKRKNDKLQEEEEDKKKKRKRK